MPDANEFVSQHPGTTSATSLKEYFSSEVFDNILAHLGFLCLTFGSGNNIVWMRILRVSRGDPINYRELIKYARPSPTPMENSLKPVCDSPLPGPSLLMQSHNNITTV